MTVIDVRPSICVGVVTGHPRLDHARAVIGDLSRQTVPPAELFVVIQQEMSSTAVRREDLLRDVDPQALPLTLVTNVGRGLSEARNLIIDRSRSDLLVFMDDDARMPPEAIDRISHAYVHHTDVAALTFQVDWTGEGVQRMYPSAEQQRDTVRRLTSVASIEIVVSRAVLLELGVRFDERFGLGAPFATGEELVLLVDILRAGGTIVFVPEVIARHPAATSGTRSDESLMRSRGALFRRIFGGPGLAVGLASAVRDARRGRLVCSLPSALRAVSDGWRRLGKGTE